jgi:outer membrane protein OmpA-like peptidoglycan-associated protein
MKIPFLSLLAAATIGLASCDSLNKPSEKDEPQEATADTAVVYRDGQTAGDAMAGAANATADAFDLSKARLAEVSLPEIKNKGITVRGDNDYHVYSVDEKVLFDTDKATVKPSAAAALQEIMGSIGQRFAGKDVRVMGFADSRGNASYNLDLAKQRAEAVKSYLVQTGKMAEGKVSTESFGEQQPAATNATAEGRQENRRVEIAVRMH